MSIEGLALLLLVAVALAALALWRSRRADQLLRTVEEDLRRAQAAGQEQAQRIAALETLRDSTQLAEHAIATGTAVVKEVHKGIADIPFSVLEAIPATREPAKVLRGLHDSISEGIYGAISGLNKAVGRELRKGVPLAEPRPEVVDEPPAPPHLESLPARTETPEAAPPSEEEGSRKSWG